ncbi:RNA polymerase sigma-70 factor (ECF subfamily) [Metabacillus crassostreae]|uniref:sigma-70 family RNA polymerase sigma factor n=1 Tax=Metabacillus crassostreae TaxID=929098 RepID=UPI00195B4DA0|nr:sigma-70 family RNA polymerase sigma factor [Metabacillus crassostreae]MBM7606602.1 RNA polymerase sigma-70 factor (ECF subfamily) [Metabacillus crassostreae]
MDKHERDKLLEQIMIDHGSELVRLAYTYVKDKETAKDMVQNAFVKCYENLDGFRHDAQLKTWLYRITINQCKDYLKSWHYKKVKTLYSIQETAKSFFPSTEKTVVDDYEKQEIYEHISSLPDKYREVIYLYYYKSLKIEEISDITNIQINTVKTRLKRAKKKLKLKLEEAEVYG